MESWEGGKVKLMEIYGALEAQTGGILSSLPVSVL